jgi:hypothetical protein
MHTNAKHPSTIPVHAYKYKVQMLRITTALTHTTADSRRRKPVLILPRGSLGEQPLQSPLLTIPVSFADN